MEHFPTQARREMVVNLEEEDGQTTSESASESDGNGDNFDGNGDKEDQSQW